MTTLKQLRDSIDEYLAENPNASDYPVYTFDYFNGQSAPAELVKEYKFLGEDACKQQFIFDTVKEANEWDDSEEMTLRKIILL